jgi:hexosaminidase
MLERQQVAARSRRIGARLLAGLLLGALLPRYAIDATTPTVPLSLRWQPAPEASVPVVPADGLRAQFTLTNTGLEPLPARGWSLYFDCEEGVLAGVPAGGFVFEQIAGTFYRMHPAEGFAGLASGQSALIPFTLLGPPQNEAEAPRGPYLAFDAAPETAQALTDYQVAPVPDRSDVRTPEQTYERNALQVQIQASELPPVLPSPQRYERRTGELHWASMPEIFAPAALHAEAARARSLLAVYFPAPAETRAAGAQRARPAGARAAPLRLRVAPIPGATSPEAYELQVDARSGVSLQGQGAAGVARGLESLRQLLPLARAPADGVAVPAISISDAPRFAYRGLMLDVARNFQSKQTVFQVLDLMARFKLNVFHFHLTDDEGWRLEIPGLPELTAIGARRGHLGARVDRLPPAYGSGPDPATPFGSGYYSGAEYIEILKYAAALHIEVIPEIEMPGHARAAVVAMAERARRLGVAGDAAADRYVLNDRADASVYSSAQLYHDNVMNPALPSTYAFIGKVVDALVAMHRAANVPLRTVHVGGDELPDGAWEHSPACAALMQREHFSDRRELWEYFYRHVDQLLRSRGLAAAGWEELGAMRQGPAGHSRVVPNPNMTGRGFTLFVWRNVDGADDLAYRLANVGYDVVLTPATRLYLDMSAFSDPGEAGQTWAAHVDLDTVFDYIPYDDVRVAPDNPARLPNMERLMDASRNRVKGIEAPLFGETLYDPTRLDFMLVPRMLAAAERAWAPDPPWTTETDAVNAARLHAEAWSRFVAQLGFNVLPRLDAELPQLHYRLPPPGLKRSGDTVLVNEQIPGLTLRYTVDGSAPTTHSPLVNGAISATGSVRVAAFDRNGRAGRAAQIGASAAGGK